MAIHLNSVKKCLVLFIGIFFSLSLYCHAQSTRNYWTVVDNNGNALSGYRLPGTEWNSVKKKGYSIHAKGVLIQKQSRLNAYAWHPKRNVWIQLSLLNIIPVPKTVDSTTSYEWEQDIKIPDWAWVRGHKGGRADVQLRIASVPISPLNPYEHTLMPDCEASGDVNSPCTLTVYTANHRAKFTGLGYLNSRFEDWNSNTCVSGVESQFAQLNSLPKDADGFILSTGTTTFNPKVGAIVSGFEEPIKDYTNSKNHIQGFSRIPSLNNSQLMAFTRSNLKPEGGPSGLFIVKMNKELPTDGEAFFRTIRASNDDVVRRENQPVKAFVGHSELENPVKVGSSIVHNEIQNVESEVIFMQNIPGTFHPDGIQVMGNIIAVPSWCSKDGRKKDICNNAIISFYKISYSTRTPEISVSLVNRFERGQKGWKNPISKFSIDSDKAYFMAITRMSSGHYIIFINRSDAGHTDIFVSESKVIHLDMEWKRLDTDKFNVLNGYDTFVSARSKLKRSWDFNDTYQNFNFVTDCHSGKIYALGLSQESETKNQIDLFAMSVDGRSKVGIIRINQQNLSKSKLPNSDSGCCEMKGGAGIYVTPSGRLIIYCMQKYHRPGDSQDEFWLSEFAKY